MENQTKTKPQTIYFAYGSNLHLHQMSLRCPESRYIGRGVLPNCKWQINTRGYANIIPSPKDRVEGLCFLLSKSDEARLDINEGVPFAYEKIYLDVQSFTASAQLVGRSVQEVEAFIGDDEKMRDAGSRVGNRYGEDVRMLVYVCKQVEDGRPRREYVKRIRDGIEDAVKLGISRTYFHKYVEPMMKGKTMEDLKS